MYGGTDHLSHPLFAIKQDEGHATEHDSRADDEVTQAYLLANGTSRVLHQGTKAPTLPRRDHTKPLVKLLGLSALHSLELLSEWVV